MQTEIRCVKLNNFKWVNLIGTLHWTTVLLNLHVQTGLIYARSLTESGPCVSTWLARGLDVRVAVWLRTWVCVSFISHRAHGCVPRCIEEQQTWARAELWNQATGYKGPNITNPTTLGSRFQNLEINLLRQQLRSQTNARSHIYPTLIFMAYLSEMWDCHCLESPQGSKCHIVPPRWTIRCLSVSKNSRHTSCVGNSRQQHSALVPLWPLGMLYDQLFLKHANMLKQNVAETSNPSTQSAQCEYHRHIRQSDIKITLYCSNLRRWQLYSYREH